MHLQHRASGQPPTPVTVPQGATITIGCSTWLDPGCLKDLEHSRGPIVFCISLQLLYTKIVQQTESLTKEELCHN